MTEQNKIKVAVIDMNCGHPNQGMRGIQEILIRFKNESSLVVNTDIFNIRQTAEVPDLSYDIYISSGGPGSPYDGEGKTWENKFFHLLDEIDHHNSIHVNKKYVFLICHSFQLACRKYQLGNVTKRKSTAFGIFPTSLTTEGVADTIFEGITNPFYTVDSRDWQVIEPDIQRLTEKKASILAIEKERPHVNLERCVMAIRFSPYMVGTQFHPEADATGMKMYLLQEQKKLAITAQHGEEKYDDMLNSLDDPKRIRLTQQIVLPNFLSLAVNSLLCTEKN